MAAFSVAPGVDFGDTVIVRAALEGAKHNSDLAWAVVIDSAEHTMAHYISPVAEQAYRNGMPHRFEELIHSPAWLSASAAVKSGDRKIGTVYLGMSLNAVTAEVDAQHRFALIVSRSGPAPCAGTATR